MDERARRIVENEALFRAINERLRTLPDDFTGVLEDEFICECGDIACTQRIRMRPDEYERVRADPTQFAIAAGHAALDVEDVVGRTDRYEIVVKKAGPAAELAKRRDERSA